MGFAWVNADGEPSPPPTKPAGWFRRRQLQEPPLAEENVLRNEFFELQFDPTTGAIRTISDYRSRDPRLAQQIALREPQGSNPTAEANYSRMAADELRVAAATPLVGEMLSRGRLLDRDGNRVAGYRQKTRVRRGSRTIELEIELETNREPGHNPWDSYYAVRFAWKDETATLHRDANMADVATDLQQFEAPHFVDIRHGTKHATVLAAGLPYHHRIGPRRLDTLLVPRGETERTFRLGIGIDVPNPMAAAIELIAPALTLDDQPSPPTPTGWLFHLDCRNVLATHWEPLPGDCPDFRASENGTVPLRSHRLPRSPAGNRRSRRTARPALFPPVGISTEGRLRRRAAAGAYRRRRSHQRSDRPVPMARNRGPLRMTPAVRLVLLPGLGADDRLLEPQRDEFPDLLVPPWIPPTKNESLAEYAGRMAATIPRATDVPMILGGVSFGGMLACEMVRHLTPRAVVLIASCRTPDGLRPACRVGRVLLPLVPLHAWTIAKALANVVLKLRTGVPRERRELAVTMFREMDSRFMHWILHAILSWNPAPLDDIPVFHIHGGRDFVIPARRVAADAIVPDGGHLINVTHAAAVNAFLRAVSAGSTQDRGQDGP